MAISGSRKTKKTVEDQPNFLLEEGVKKGDNTSEKENDDSEKELGDPKQPISYAIFLTTSKIFRIAVSGDVLVTELEKSIIDTAHFQRLRRVRQLGSVNFVYPTALHTRFDHCIGTMAMAERMMQAIEVNTHSEPHEKKIEDDERILVRLYALLHDIPHVPFGHTIEDELALFERHDKNIERLKTFLGPESPIGKLIRDNLNDEMYERFWSIYLWDGQTKSKTDRPHANELKEVKEKGKALLGYFIDGEGTDKKVFTVLKKSTDAFIYDLVSNTVCADLLDYLARDSYFCNLGSVLEYRFLNFLYFADHNGLKRVLVRLWKKDRKPRRDTLTDLTRLLEARYLIAERAYFHHAKIISGAMLGRALYEQRIFDEGKEEGDKTLTEKKLYDHSDDTLLKLLKESENPATKKLGELLWDRKLYKCLKTFNKDEFDNVQSRDHEDNALKTARDQIDNPEKRTTLENELAAEIGAAKGDVIIYSPDPKMNMKAADVKVLWNGAIVPLKDIDDKVIKPRLEQILSAHELLWAIHILVAPKNTTENASRKNASSSQEEKSDIEIAGIQDNFERLENLSVLSRDQLDLLEAACNVRFLHSIRGLERKKIPYYEKLIEYNVAQKYPDNVITLKKFRDLRSLAARKMVATEKAQLVGGQRVIGDLKTRVEDEIKEIMKQMPDISEK